MADGFQLAGGAAEVEEHHGAGFIVHAGEIVASVRRLGEKGEGDGGADPGSGDGGEADGADAAGVVDAQVEALRGSTRTARIECPQRLATARRTEGCKAEASAATQLARCRRWCTRIKTLSGMRTSA